MGERLIIFSCVGGHGKNILATAVIEAIKKEYPERKIIVLTAWHQAYYHNPNVYKFFNFDAIPNYFYDDYIKDKDVLVFQHDPYHTTDYIKKNKHLIEIWCDMYDIPYNREQPKLYINPREIEIVKDKIKPHLGKKIMIIHSNGGLPQQNVSKKSWARDLPQQNMVDIINHYKDKYRILHIRLDEQLQYDGVESLMLPLREIYASLLLSEKRICIDSFAHHASAALNLPSVVCWIVNKPSVLGYDIHHNITTNAKIVSEMRRYSVFEEYSILGQIQEFPYDRVDLFDSQDIINAVDGT